MATLDGLPSAVQGYVAYLFLGGMASILLYRAQINRAASNGNGVRMHMYTNETTLTQHVVFYPR